MTTSMIPIIPIIKANGELTMIVILYHVFFRPHLSYFRIQFHVHILFLDLIIVKSLRLGKSVEFFQPPFLTLRVRV